MMAKQANLRCDRCSTEEFGMGSSACCICGPNVPCDWCGQGIPAPVPVAAPDEEEPRG